MSNRNPYSPILFTLVVSLLIGPALFSQAEPGVPSDSLTTTNSTPAAPAPTPAPAPPSATTPVAASTENPSTYTVAAGDSLWSIAHKFGTTVKQLEKLNKLKSHLLHPGQVLQIPPAKGNQPATSPSPAPKPPKTTSQIPVKSKPAMAARLSRKTSHHPMYAQAQPVQDFDIPASTFASCPVPVPSGDADADSSDATEIASTGEKKPAPIAELVSPSELAAASAPDTDADVAPPVVPAKPLAKAGPNHFTSVPSFPSIVKFSSRAPAPISSPFFTTASNDWGNRFLQEARALGDRGIEYDEDWRPPGESQSWAMDCSNTSRYLYKVTTGIQLPRTASDQYYYLHLQDKAWEVPQAANGWADCNFLRHHLKPGNLLFWENTYRPERQPPITHVMVFLGTNDKGEWLMAGSQTSRGGEHNRRNGGPDVYIFRPTQPCGGYTTWLGLVHHQGRFCAFGRPLEADKSKLAMAAND